MRMMTPQMRVTRRRVFLCLLVFVAGAAPTIYAEDWPEWRGAGRLGVWTETGILETFPKEGLKVLWRTPIKSGFAGPTVADGRVFVLDFAPSQILRGTERVLALDERTGRVLWSREWPVSYVGMLDTWATGPRTTPTVDGNRVYVLGGAGLLLCLDVETGNIIWQKDYVKDYHFELSMFGLAAAPLVDGNRLIALVGGQPNAKVVAFDKMTGKEIWRALDSNSEPGHSAPIIINVAGVRQLIVWHSTALSSLDPVTGKSYWDQPARGLSVATPVLSGLRLLVSSFYTGSVMLGLSADRPEVRELWKGQGTNEIQTDGLHSLTSTPVIDGDYVYGICSFGQLRCLKASTGERVWETQLVTKERARWASAQIVRHGDRYFLNNDRGELIIARLTPQGYHEISRTHLIKPTTPPGNRRQLEAINWTHPAYANKHIYVRNDEEILCASLAANGE